MALTYDVGPLDLAAFLRPAGKGRSRLDLLVPDARCAACLSKVEREVGALPGVASARLNLSQKRLSVEFASEGPDAAAVVATLGRLGYPATPFDPGAARDAHDREGRRLSL
ncbi:MAG: heavy-metal-associated domain-containing protein, partial [Phenylobacterium sp.]|uniref:cation transporter n=1 Tax=Phenylobacterium sp. TaxID=1871053 RepID=UPI001A585C78